MKEKLNKYRQLFEKLDKGHLYEINEPFLEEIIAVKDRIVALRKLSGDNFIIVHPKNPQITRVSETEKWLMKVEETYKNMMLALNKILGKTELEEDEFMKDIENEYKN